GRLGGDVRGSDPLRSREVGPGDQGRGHQGRVRWRAFAQSGRKRKKSDLSRVSVGTAAPLPNCSPSMPEDKPMKAILFVLATGIVASAIVELVDGWRRYQSRKARRAVTR